MAFPLTSSLNMNPSPLFSFKAGRMTCGIQKENGKMTITPSLEKGECILLRRADDTLHFQWKDRTSKVIGDDFVVLPNDSTFERVSTGRPLDRVYILQHKTNDTRSFFWMQDKKTELDAANQVKMNAVINGTSTGVDSPGSNDIDQNMLMSMMGGSSTGSENLNLGRDLQGILSGMGYPPTSSSSTGTAATTNVSSTSVPSTASSLTNTTTTTAVDDDDMTEEELLQRAIEESMKDSTPDTEEGNDMRTDIVETPASMTQAPTPATSVPGTVTMADMQRAMSMFQQQTPPVSLLKLLTPENVHDTLMDVRFQHELLSLLPEERQTVHELMETILTPQFKTSVASLSEAISTGEFSSFMHNFGLDPKDGAEKINSGDAVGAFLDALQAWASRNP